MSPSSVLIPAPRRPWRTASVLAVLAVIVTPVLASHLTGGFYRLIGSPTGGGGRSDGGSYWVIGSVPTPAVGVSTNGDYELMGGLVGVYALETEGGGDVTLTVTRSASGEAVLSWPSTAEGYQLEMTLAPGPGAVWQTVTPSPVGSTYTTAFEGPARFYRLRKP